MEDDLKKMKKWKTTSQKIEDDLKKMEDNLKKIKNEGDFKKRRRTKMKTT